MRRIAIIALFLILFTKSAYALASGDIWEDMGQKLSISEVGKTINRKIQENIAQKPEYFHESTERLLELQYEPKLYLTLGRDQDILEDRIRDDLVDSAKYGIERSVRNLELYSVARQWLRGLLSIQVDKPRRKGVVIAGPSINRPLDAYDEARNELGFECNHLVGKSAETFRRHILCFEKEILIKREEEANYKFRVRPGIDMSGNIKGSLSIVPSIEPFIEMRLPRFDFKLSYSYPVTLYKGKRNKTNTLFDDFEDAFLKDEVGDHDRLRLQIKRYLVTDRFSLVGSYQFERETGRNFVGISPQYISYPYRISIPSVIEVGTMRPRITLSIDRIMQYDLVLGEKVIKYNMVFGVGGFVNKDPENNWNYQIGATTQITW